MPVTVSVLGYTGIYWIKVICLIFANVVLEEQFPVIACLPVCNGLVPPVQGTHIGYRVPVPVQVPGTT
jgi:hypothetical protein